MQEQKDFFEVLMNEDTKFFNDNIMKLNEEKEKEKEKEEEKFDENGIQKQKTTRIRKIT